MSTDGFSIRWKTVSLTGFSAVPLYSRTQNDLDRHGIFLDLPRIQKESNTSYFKRLQSVIPLRGGSDHIGLIHGITRELGLEEKIGLRLSPVLEGGRWKARSPHIEVTSTHLLLFSEYISPKSFTLEKAIPLTERGSSYLLEGVLSEVSSSEYFVGELGPLANGRETASGLFPGSSVVQVLEQYIPSSTFFVLDHKDVLPGTLSFTDKEVFERELGVGPGNPDGFTFGWSAGNKVQNPGEYYVDYWDGIVTTKSQPTGTGNCRYLYREFPYNLRWSPISIYSLRDDSYKELLFEKEPMPDHTIQHGLVTSEGSEVYTQIFNRSPCLWGR